MVLNTVITIINYDRRMFMVQATGLATAALGTNERGGNG
jgi:hypothetical protein